MKLFAICIEGKEIALVMAGNPHDALENAGLPSCLLLSPDKPGMSEKYSIIEVDHLNLRLLCGRTGDLTLHDADEGTFEWLFELQPKAKLPAMMR